MTAYSLTELALEETEVNENEGYFKLKVKINFDIILESVTISYILFSNEHPIFKSNFLGEVGDVTYGI